MKQTSKKNAAVLAIDIGGTNIKAGLVDRAGTIRHMLHRPSHAARGRNALLAVLADVVAIQTRRAPIVAVGCGSPGTINHATGMVTYMQTHMPGWTGTPLRQQLERMAGVPATVDNDVNLVALGEHWKGAGRGARCQLSLALGTGLGGGLIVDGRVFHGAGGRATEFGHMIVKPGGEPCTCGNFGCVEQYAAPGAMARRAAYYLTLGVPSVLARCATISAADIIKHAGTDHLCRQVFTDAIDGLALVMWNLLQALDPDVIVIGGGLVKAGNALMKPLRAALATYYNPPALAGRVTLKVSTLGDNAGILGAARLAWDWLEHG
jgi:glucokinase